MHAKFNRSRDFSHVCSLSRAIQRVFCAFACLMAFAVSGDTGPAQQVMSNQAEPKQSIHDESITRPPDANSQMQMREQAAQRANFDAANAERKRQLTEDSQTLLKLATELKQDLDKTPKDTLSLSIVHKAEEIERLAHSVQVKMKLTVNVKN